MTSIFSEHLIPCYRHSLEDDARIILEWIFKNWGSGNGLDLSQDMNSFPALVNVVMNILFP
jgi:hypothetical protein